MSTNGPGIAKAGAEKLWHAAHPAPRTVASVVTRGTLLSWMKKGKLAGKDFVLVDLRRMDHEVSVLLITLLVSC